MKYQTRESVLNTQKHTMQCLHSLMVSSTEVVHPGEGATQPSEHPCAAPGNGSLCILLHPRAILELERNIKLASEGHPLPISSFITRCLFGDEIATCTVFYQEVALEGGGVPLG